MVDVGLIVFGLLFLFITPVGNVIFILILEILLSILSYFTSPFSLYRKRYGLTQTSGYKIYNRLRAEDRRSRAVFCIVYSLPLAIGVGLFFGLMSISMSERWTTSNIRMFVPALVIIIVLVVLFLGREYVLKTLVKAGYIQVADLP